MKRLTNWIMAKPSSTSGDVFAALDVGSSKIACFIARADTGGGPPRVIGIGHQLAEGMKNGAVANMDALQNAISAAVATAEQMAGEVIDHVSVNVSGPLLTSQPVTIELPLNGREVTEGDLQRITLQAQSMVPEDTHGHALELIHTLPTNYTLDQQKNIRDPIGMTGHNLVTDIHLLSAAFGPVRTLMTAIARCHLDIDKLVAAPYASGLSCLVEDEMDLGSMIIDMGAGTTSFAIFFDGTMHYADGIALGGAHVTNDIARGLTTPVAQAERLKTLYGNALPTAMDEREIIDVPQIGEDGPDNANHIPKSHLVRIIQPRLEETFELLRTRINKCGKQELAGRRVVLTGGASQLPGVRELAARILDKQVRLGRPLRVARPFPANSKSNGAAFTGLAEATSGPAFSTTAGLLAIAMQPELAATGGFADVHAMPQIWGRMTQWIRQNL